MPEEPMEEPKEEIKEKPIEQVPIPILPSQFAPIQHLHHGTDTPRISYNDLKDLPATSSYSKVRVHLSAGQDMAANAYTEIAFDHEDFDTNTEFDTTGHRFTAKTAGYYLVNIQVTWSNENAVDDYYEVHIYKGGATYSHGTHKLTSVSAVDSGMSFTDLVYLAVDEYIEAYFYQSNALLTFDLVANNTFMSITRLS